jgi:hypothetical protein
MRIGKELVPPFLAAVGSFEDVGWLRTLVPEFLWVALLHESLGLRAAADVGSKLVRTAHAAVPNSRVLFVRVSDYANVDAQAWAEIERSLGPADLLSLRRALWPLAGLYPECPLGPICDDSWRRDHRCDPDIEVPYLRRVVGKLVPKTSQESLQVQATAAYFAVRSGKLFFMEGTQPGDLDAMLREPDAPESRRTASSLRAMLNVFGSGAMIAPPVDWVGYFWQQGLRISLCELPSVEQGNGSEGIDSDSVVQSGRRFAASLAEELSRIWSQHVSAICVAGVGRAEVLGGLLARQAALACTLATEPGVWAVDIGYILLRCMAETHVAIAWLSRFGQAEHFDKFVEYGLGQDKLLLEHLRSVTPEHASSGWKAGLQQFEEMIARERYPHLLTVDLGQSLPKTVRDMAEECDCRHIFTLKYQPYSGNVHGTWNALRRYHLVPCANPLHGGHRVPQFRYRMGDSWLAVSAVRLLDETFSCWAQGIPLNTGGLACCRRYLAGLRRDDGSPR